MRECTAQSAARVLRQELGRDQPRPNEVVVANLLTIGGFEDVQACQMAVDLAKGRQPIGATLKIDEDDLHIGVAEGLLLPSTVKPPGMESIPQDNATLTPTNF